MARSYISTVVNRRQCAPHFYAWHTRLRSAFLQWNLLRAGVVFALRGGVLAAYCLPQESTVTEVA